MSKNIVLLTAVTIPGKESRSKCYKYGIDSWKNWCKTNNSELVVLDELLYPNEIMKVNFHRYYAFDILDNSGIEYDQICITDADCIIHPECPNFFKLTENKYTVTRAIGSMDWICRSMENYAEHLFDGKTYDIFKYFSAGFQVVNKQHRHIWKKFIDFYFENREKIISLQENFGVGTDQPVINGIVNLSSTEVKYLPYEFCSVDLKRFNLLDNELTFTKCIKGIYQFNGIPDEHRDYFMEKTYKKLINN